METEIKFETPNKESKNQKIIIYILGVLVLALTVGFVFLYLTVDKMQKARTETVSGTEKNETVENSSSNASPVSPEIRGVNNDLAAPLIGKVKEVSEEKIKIILSAAFGGSQNSQQEIEKEIEKNKVDVVKKLIKNPNFNEEKAKQIQEEMKKKYESNKGAIAEDTEEGNHLANDEDLRPFTEEIVNWSDLKVGAQVSYQKDAVEVDKMDLVILSELGISN